MPAASAARQAQQAFAATDDPIVRQTARISLAIILATAGQYFFEPAAEASGFAAEIFLFMGLAAAASKLAKR